MATVLRFTSSGDAQVPMSSEFNEVDVISTRLKLGASKINVNGEFNEMANIVPHTYGASIADAMSLTDAVYGKGVLLSNVSETATSADNISTFTGKAWFSDVSETATSTDNTSSVIPVFFYAPQAINRTPQYGTTTYPSLTPTGWTSRVSASADDANFLLSTPFNFIFNGTSYAGMYPSSNLYVTFGSGSTVYSGLGPTNPPLNKLLLGAGDWSWQLASSYTDPSNNYVRWRVEGTLSTSGTLGSPGYVYEAAVFNPAQTGGVPMFYVTFGSVAPTAYSIYICSSSAALTGGGPVAISLNRSYVFVGNSTGTTWTIYSGYSVTNTTF